MGEQAEVRPDGMELWQTDDLLCSTCMRYPPLPGLRSCAVCRERSRRSNRQREARLAESGLCCTCGKRPAREGKKTCEVCLEVARKSQARWRIRRKMEVVNAVDEQEKKQQEKKQREIERAIARDKINRHANERCLYCVWGTRMDNIQYCPFAQCLDEMNGGNEIEHDDHEGARAGSELVCG